MDEIFKEVAKLNEISKLQTTDKNNIIIRQTDSLVLI